MGQTKALLRLTPDGPTLIERAVAALRAVAGEIVVVTDRPEEIAFLGCRMTGDLYPGLGPLAGLHAGLTALTADHGLAVACDMPFLSPVLLAAMAAEPRDYDVLIPRRASGDLETLHAIYSRACLAPMAAQLQAGGGRLVGFLPYVRVRPLDEPWLRQYDPDLRAFDNLNTPDEFDAARAQPRLPHN